MQKITHELINNLYSFMIDETTLFIGYYNNNYVLANCDYSYIETYATSLLKLIEKMERELGFIFVNCDFEIFVNTCEIIHNYSTKLVDVLSFRPRNELYPEDFMAF